MDARAATFFFLLLVVFQGNPCSADDTCIYTSAHLVTCVTPVCKFACVVDARAHHAKYRNGWCKGFFNGNGCESCNHLVASPTYLSSKSIFCRGVLHYHWCKDVNVYATDMLLRQCIMHSSKIPGVKDFFEAFADVNFAITVE
uniref:Uncharacterized protein n=1 Tax=Oryza glumipatula TaxID=40148 RepID=A0A0E0B976_9ORYZ